MAMTNRGHHASCPMLRQRLTARRLLPKLPAQSPPWFPASSAQRQWLHTTANPNLGKASPESHLLSRRTAAGASASAAAVVATDTPPTAGATLATAAIQRRAQAGTTVPPLASGGSFAKPVTVRYPTFNDAVETTAPASIATKASAHTSSGSSESSHEGASMTANCETASGGSCESEKESSTSISPPLPPPPPGGQSGYQRLFASWQQGVVASIGAVMGVGFLIYMLYTPVKEDTVHHTAVVASEALGDLRLKSKAVQLSKDVVASVLQDEQSLLLVVDLVRKLLAQDDTKVAISSLLQSLFEDHYTQEVTKKFVLMIVRDPWIMDQLQVIVKEQIQRLFADDEVKTALSNFLTSSVMKSLREPELQYETARAVRSSIVRVVNPWSG